LVKIIENYRYFDFDGRNRNTDKQAKKVILTFFGEKSVAVHTEDRIEDPVPSPIKSRLFPDTNIFATFDLCNCRSLTFVNAGILMQRIINTVD
jgi:hypothetical protein